MKKTGILFIVLLAVAVFSGLAYAVPVVDVAQSPTDYFVDNDASKYDSPYYRGNGDDWEWTHNGIGSTITTATLNISAYDVDWVSWSPAYLPERDIIYAWDSGVWVELGFLTGEGDTWSYTTFDLGSNFFDDIAVGLQVKMEIDQNDQGWYVTLAKSSLSVDGGAIPNPTPGSVPEPASVLLFGIGLAGIGVLRKKFTR